MSNAHARLQKSIAGPAAQVSSWKGAGGHDIRACLLDDLVNTSVLAAVFGSLVNARAAGRSVLGGGPTLRQIPPVPERMVMEELAGDGVTTSGGQRLSLLLAYDRIAAARVLTEVELQRGAGDISWETLSECWRSAASALQAGLAAAFEIEEHEGSTGTRYRKATLIRFLAAVAAGRTPCLGVRGEIVVPGWIERRRDHRHTLLLPVTLIRREQRQRAATLDISRSGLGLIGVGDSVIGESMIVEFEKGRALHGYVAWTSNDRLGLRLFAPLAESDPLLAGGAT